MSNRASIKWLLICLSLITSVYNFSQKQRSQRQRPMDGWRSQFLIIITHAEHGGTFCPGIVIQLVEMTDKFIIYRINYCRQQWRKWWATAVKRSRLVDKKEEATTGNEQNERYIGHLPGGTPHQSLVNHLLASLPKLSNATPMVLASSRHFFLGLSQIMHKILFLPVSWRSHQIHSNPIQATKDKEGRRRWQLHCCALLVQTLMQACH